MCWTQISTHAKEAPNHRKTWLSKIATSRFTLLAAEQLDMSWYRTLCNLSKRGFFSSVNKSNVKTSSQHLTGYNVLWSCSLGHFVPKVACCLLCHHFWDNIVLVSSCHFYFSVLLESSRESNQLGVCLSLNRLRKWKTLLESKEKNTELAFFGIEVSHDDHNFLQFALGHSTV